MLTRPHHRCGDLPVVAVLMAVLAMVAVWFTPMSACADPPKDQIQVELESVNPATLGNEGDLVLSGTVTNTTEEPLTDLGVQLWRDARPITSLDVLAEAVEANGGSGAVMQSAPAHDYLGDGSLGPGQTKQFTVRAAMGSDAEEQLWLSQPGAAYRIGVEVRSMSSWNDSWLGAARTVISLPGSVTAHVAPIVQLNAIPSMTEPTTLRQTAQFADNRLAIDLTQRLIPLTNYAQANGLQVVVDPLLFDEATALAASHLEGADTAQAWLEIITAMLAQQRLVRSLYGSPDIASLLVADEQLAQRSAQLPEAHPLAGAQLWIIPAGGTVTQAMLDAFPQASVVLGSNTSGVNGSTRVLRTSSIIDPHTPEGTWTSLAAAEQVVAGTQGTAMVSVVTTLAQLTWLSSTASIRTWIEASAIQTGEPVDLAQLADASPNGTLAARTQQTRQLVTTWCAMVTDETCVDSLIPGAWSTRWSSPNDALAWLDALDATPSAGVGAGGIELATSDWVTTSAEDNQLPVTITNRTAHQVHLLVKFTSANPLRIEVPDSEVMTISPGESATVRVKPRTQGNGTVAFTAQALTPSRIPVGDPVDFSITGTNAGRIGWIIIIASGAVLLGATALRVRQVRHENRDAATT